MALYFDPEYPMDKLVKIASRSFQEGGLIIYPTDTVYGMGCDITARDTIKKLFQVKQIKGLRPLSFLCKNISQVTQYAQVSDTAYNIMKEIFQGPYTIILKTTKLVPKILLTHQTTVGIRIPSHPVIHAILENLERPIINTSVSTGTKTFLSDPGEIYEKFKNFADIIIDSGIMLEEYSSIIDLTENKPQIYRHGKGDLSWLEKE